MATIVERAYERLGIRLPKEGMTTGMPFKPGGLERMFFNGYCKGATDQRKIDIDKAMKWMNSRYSFDMDNAFFEAFRNAMEEE